MSLRRLFLVGFCLVLDSVLPGTAPGTLLQLLIAFAFCLLTLLLTAVASPFKSDVDDAVAKAFGIALVAVFFFALILKVNVLTDSVDEYLPKQLQNRFALDIVVVSIGMTMSVALALVVTALVAIQQLVHAARPPVIKLRSTSSRPALTVDHGIIWQLFLSHIWSTGQDQVSLSLRLFLSSPSLGMILSPYVPPYRQCAAIKRQLCLLMPGVAIFLGIPFAALTLRTSR